MPRVKVACRGGGKPYVRMNKHHVLYRKEAGKGGLRIVLKPRSDSTSFVSRLPPNMGKVYHKFNIILANEGLKVTFKKVPHILADGYRLLNMDLLRQHMTFTSEPIYQ